MKKLLLVFALFSLLACKKEPEKISETSAQDSIRTTTLDSIQIPTFEDPDYSGPFKIIPQNIASEKGRAIFTQNGKVLFFFDQNANRGIINIDGKKFALLQFDFSENNYTISGDGVKITATEGDFTNNASECIQGKFPEIEISYNNKTLNLTNIDVLDCPNY